MVAQAVAQVLQGLQWHKGHDSEWSLDYDAEEEAVLAAEEAASSHGEVRQSPSWSLRTDARGWFGRWFTAKKGTSVWLSDASECIRVVGVVVVTKMLGCLLLITGSMRQGEYSAAR